MAKLKYEKREGKFYLGQQVGAAALTEAGPVEAPRVEACLVVAQGGGEARRPQEEGPLAEAGRARQVEGNLPRFLVEARPGEGE